VSDSQTAYALALTLGLLRDPDQRALAGRRLVELVRRKGHRIATGFLGTSLICDALTGAGAVDDAYQLLRQTECPSWLYQVTMAVSPLRRPVTGNCGSSRAPADASAGRGRRS
jgi:alpha-L-rhamnosidase